MRSRRLLVFTAVIAVLGAAAWFVAGDGGHETSVARASRAAARAPEASAPVEDASGARREAAPVSDAAPQRAVESAASVRRIFGRVVDARRFAVAGARVRFTATGREPREVTSRANGGFEFAFASVGTEYVSGALFAVGPDGALAERRAVLIPDRSDGGYDGEHPRDFDAGALTVLPPARIVVHVRDDRGPVAGAEVTAEISSEHWFPPPALLPIETTDANGIARLAAPIGDATVSATVPGRATARVWTACESGAEQVLELVLHPTASVTIRVRDAETKEPVANAHVVLTEQFIARQVQGYSYQGPERMFGSGHLPDLVCDANGVAHFDDFDPERQFSLKARAPGYSSTEGTQVQIAATSREVELLLSPSAGKPLRFAIVADELPIPRDGSVVALRQGNDAMGGGLASAATVEHGELVVARPAEGWFSVVAVSPDGGLASFGFDVRRPEGKTVCFKKPRTLALRLRFADGRVAAGARVGISYGSGLPMTVQADDQGRAMRDGLLAARVDVAAEGVFSTAMPLATADLRQGDASVDVVLPEPIEAVLAVTLDGQPGLPPTFHVGSMASNWKIESEDPARGELRVGATAAATEEQVEAWLTAPPCLPAKFSVPVVRGGAPPVVPVPLVHGATLRLDVKRAANQKFGLWIQRQGDDGEFANLPDQFRVVDRLNGANGLFEFSPLAAGTWRVLDQVTQLASEPVALANGEERIETLDLSGAVVIHGRVTAPAGTDFKDVRIVARGEPVEVASDRFARPTYPGTFVKSDFTFERTIDGAKPFVRAWHPSLASPPGDPYVEVRDATQPVELALVDRPSLAFTVARTCGAISPSEWDLNYRFSITLDREDGDHARVTRSCTTTGAASEVVHLVEIPTGRWTLFLDPGGEAAPLFRTGVEISEAGTDLGTLTLGPGSVLRVQIADGRANKSGPFNVSAHHVGAPEYTRWWQRAVGPELLLPGLGAGNFDVKIGDSTGKEVWRGTAECDGAHETALAVDLR
jgi:hypothetical protein